MLVLGFSGGQDAMVENPFTLDRSHRHDAGAALVEDGRVLFAAEEERLSRIRHTNQLPVRAIGACLASVGARLGDIDRLAYYERNAGFRLKRGVLKDARAPATVDAAAFFQERFRRELGAEIDRERLCFVDYQSAHAMGALALSGFAESLCVVFGGEGDDSSGMVLWAGENGVEERDRFAGAESLGRFYLSVIPYLGCVGFDEYRLLDLAAKGTPGPFRETLRTLYALLPNGQYEIRHQNVLGLFDALTPRRAGEPFEQAHHDLAAALQQSLEEIALHVIGHHQKVTRARNLCLAGGLTHNGLLNGTLLRSGLFENVFVQPAANDAGCALGAALHVGQPAKPGARTRARTEHLYWGTEVGSEERVRRELGRWDRFLEFQREASIVERTADLLAGGQVVGWVQGRSEFGPRPLGNRSILADPRPAGNKDRINGLLKNRAEDRLFAPSVVEDDAEKFFDLGGRPERHHFMTFVVEVREEKREQLAAVTRVDGTAYVQTVSPETNERLWRLIRAFGRRTGVPVLLNTSFDNDVEPRVDSVEDAIACFLTTGLDSLVIGDYLVRKREASWEDYLSLSLSLPAHIALHHVKERRHEAMTDLFYLAPSRDRNVRHALSGRLAGVLAGANTRRAVREVVGKVEAEGALVTQLKELWARGLVVLRPDA